MVISLEHLFLITLFAVTCRISGDSQPPADQISSIENSKRLSLPGWLEDRNRGRRSALSKRAITEVSDQIQTKNVENEEQGVESAFDSATLGRAKPSEEFNVAQHQMIVS
jgi:hypothetical protein